MTTTISYTDCVDNRLPFWSGAMLRQLKTLLNTPGKSYDDLIADDNWPVYIFNYGDHMRRGEKVSKTVAMKVANEMGGKANGWQKKKFIPPSPEKEKNPKEMTKAELLIVLSDKSRLTTSQLLNCGYCLTHRSIE